MKIFVFGTRGFPGVQGGVEKHCEELYPRLSRYGCEITVFARAQYFTKNRTSHWNNIKFIYLWCPLSKGIESFVHTFIANLICVVKQPDIAHFHNMGHAIFIPLARFFGIKTVLSYHSVNYEHQKWSSFAKSILRLGEFLGLKFSNRVIIISKTTKEFLEKKYKKNDLEFIPNGVNLAEIIPAGAALKKYNLKSKRYVFTACRFVPEKGLHDLIAAYHKIDNPDLKLAIAGDADHEDEYSRNLKKSAEGNSSILLTGFLSGKPLQELYSNAALFVLPSYYEGLSIALLEALSYGLPVLVSDIPQNREIPLPDFRYFRVGDIDDLYRKMRELINTGITEEDKKCYRELLEKEYNWDKIAQLTLNVYKSVVADSGGLLFVEKQIDVV